MIETLSFELYMFSLEVDVIEYCKYHSDAILPSPDNCAKYYNCKGNDNPVEECPYPSLFSQTTNKCEQFSMVFCGSRPEQVAPCKSTLVAFLIISSR